MNRRISRGKGRRRAIASLFILALAGGLFFLQAGNLLVAEDSFPHAEAALVLSGDPIARSLAARDLYQQGRVDEILIIPEPPHPYQEELAKLGLTEEGKGLSLSKRILTASGVPPAKIQFLPGPADGTLQEALLVRRFLKGRFPRRLALVTSKFSSRRARFIFRQLLRKEKVQIFCAPSPYDPFKPKGWWSQPRNALMVVMEYQKFLANVFTLVLGLHAG